MEPAELASSMPAISFGTKPCHISRGALWWPTVGNQEDFTSPDLKSSFRSRSTWKGPEICRRQYTAIEKVLTISMTVLTSDTLANGNHFAHRELSTVDTAHLWPFAFVLHSLSNDFSKVLHGCEAHAVVISALQR